MFCVNLDFLWKVRRTAVQKDHFWLGWSQSSASILEQKIELSTILRFFGVNFWLNYKLFHIIIPILEEITFTLLNLELFILCRNTVEQFAKIIKNCSFR